MGDALVAIGFGQPFNVGAVGGAHPGVAELLGSLGKGCIEVGIDGLRHWDEGNYYETKYELLKTMPEKCCWVITSCSRPCPRSAAG